MLLPGLGRLTSIAPSHTPQEDEGGCCFHQRILLGLRGPSVIEDCITGQRSILFRCVCWLASVAMMRLSPRTWGKSKRRTKNQKSWPPYGKLLTKVGPSVQSKERLRMVSPCGDAWPQLCRSTLFIRDGGTQKRCQIGSSQFWLFARW